MEIWINMPRKCCKLIWYLHFELSIYGKYLRGAAYCNQLDPHISKKRITSVSFGIQTDKLLKILPKTLWSKLDTVLVSFPLAKLKSLDKRVDFHYSHQIDSIKTGQPDCLPLIIVSLQQRALKNHEMSYRVFSQSKYTYGKL